MSFENLNLHESLLKAVQDAGYAQATEVQQRAMFAAWRRLMTAEV